MTDVYQILSGFSYGELDPKLAARVDFNAYLRGVKTANNVLSIPQGGFTRRFGTTYVATLTATNYLYAKVYSLVYDNVAVYTLLFEHNTIGIYLENTLVATVATTYPDEIVRDLYFTVVQNRLIILHQNFAPAQLIRSAVAANIITGVVTANDYITITNALTVDNIYAATFTTAGALPVSDPRLYINTTYYVRPITATNIRVYSTPEDAADNTNFFNITAGGVGNLILQNTWTLSNIAFSNLPAYDFDFFATYSAAGFTFTPSATTGTYAAPLTITASGNVFTVAMIGGLFFGNSGIVRLTVYTDAQHMDGWTYEAFANGNAFSGREAFLGEPAWSANRGYPSCGTFFQERLFLGGSRGIPNGVWGSTIFAVYDFDDSSDLADNAISYYTSAGQSNIIKSMTSSKSLIVHTNTGNYSTPLTIEIPLTPATFSLTEQNNDGVSSVVPVSIDNQLIYVDRSANNVKAMAWDIAQSSYMNTNISLISSHLVNSPIDMDVFREPAFTDGYYVIFVNSDGKLGIYNSLMEQDIKGWTKADTAQNDTDGYFRDLSSGLNRAWVITERTINGATVLYLEELDFDVLTDCSASYNFTIATDTLTGLNHLEGEIVQVFADDVVLGDETVTGGSITLDTVANEVFVGLKYTSTVTPLPINVMMQNGPSLYQSVHIRALQIHYYDSIGLQIQGYDIPTINIQDVELDYIHSVLGDNAIAGVDIINDYITVTDALTLDNVYAATFTTAAALPVTTPQIVIGTTYYIRAITVTSIRVYTTIDDANSDTDYYDVTGAGTGNVVFQNNRTLATTGVYEYTMMEGWNAFNYSINIVQEYPLPMTILAIGYNLEV